MISMKTKQSLENLGNALDRFEEALQRDPGEDQLLIDGTIQRFEFVIELLNKSLKRLISDFGEEVNTPMEIMKTAYQYKWINDEQLWLRMRKDRKMTSQTYNNKMAIEIFTRTKEYYPVLRETYRHIVSVSESVEQ